MSLRALAALGVFLAWATVGCAKSSLIPGVVGADQEVDITIEDPDGVDKWSVLTSSDQDVVVLRLSGEPIAMGVLRVRVLLPGDVLVAQLVPPRAGQLSVGVEQFSIALSGRPATWTVALSLGEDKRTPVRYRMSVARPSPPGPRVGPACADTLRARGINAWVMSVPGPPDTGGIVFPGLGAIGFTASPAGTVTAASPGAAAPPVMHLRGGTVLQAGFAGLGCDLGHVQLNLWDTGKGKPPTLSISDASARSLEGSWKQIAQPTPRILPTLMKSVFQSS